MHREPQRSSALATHWVGIKAQYNQTPSVSQDRGRLARTFDSFPDF
jgi:hypothetical protein